jgi:hypothetical protein
MNTPSPKQAKKAKNTMTNSLLCMEYSRICTDLSETNKIMNFISFKYRQITSKCVLISSMLILQEKRNYTCIKN